MKRYTPLIALLSIFVVACGNIAGGDNNVLPSPINAKAKGSYRIVTYNVGAINKFVSDDFTKEDNVRLLADIIREADADAVCFQELDSCNLRNNYFQLETLVDAIGGKWQYHYAPAIKYREGKYGTGVAVSRKGAECYHIPISTPEGSEDRVVAVMEYDDYVIASTHLNGSQPDQIKIITAAMKERYGNSEKPIFLGGDMNATPTSQMMNEFRKDWVVLSKTSDATVFDRPVCIDYVLQFKNKAAIAKVTDSQVITEANAGSMRMASDHYAVFVDVVTNK